MTSTDEAKNALAQRHQPAQGGGRDLRTLIQQQKGEIARALTNTGLDPDRFARIALTVVRQSPQLQRCRPESLLGALMTCAQLGLEPGPLGEAYLLPFKQECQFVPGYQGLVKLAWQSGQIRHIDAADVRENDEFSYTRGSAPVLHHVPALRDRGDVLAYYAVATFINGGHTAVVMSPEDINRVRDRSQSARSKDSPWQTDYDAMARKTCVKQLAKWLPKSTTLASAVSADGTVRTTVDSTVDESVTDQVIDATAEPAEADTAEAEPVK